MTLLSPPSFGGLVSFFLFLSVSLSSFVGVSSSSKEEEEPSFMVVFLLSILDCLLLSLVLEEDEVSHQMSCCHFDGFFTSSFCNSSSSLYSNKATVRGGTLTLLTPGAQAVIDLGQTCAVTLRRPPDPVTPAVLAAPITDPKPPALLLWL